MKKTTITISYDEEKLSALKLYLEQRKTCAEDELVRALDTLYTKTVPAGVRDFLDMRSGVQKPASEKPRAKKPKSVSSAVVDDVGASAQDGN